jgi:hypothetical protein
MKTLPTPTPPPSHRGTAAVRPRTFLSVKIHTHVSSTAVKTKTKQYRRFTCQRNRTGKKTPGGAGTQTVPIKRHRGEPGHTRDTHGTRGRTRAHGSHRRTSQPSKVPNPPTHKTQPARQRDDRSRGRLNQGDSTAAGPEPTAPRGRLRSVPVKRHRGSRRGAGTHTGHTGAHGHTGTGYTQQSFTAQKPSQSHLSRSELRLFR